MGFLGCEVQVLQRGAKMWARVGIKHTSCLSSVVHAGLWAWDLLRGQAHQLEASPSFPGDLMAFSRPWHLLTPSSGKLMGSHLPRHTQPLKGQAGPRAPAPASRLSPLCGLREHCPGSQATVHQSSSATTCSKTSDTALPAPSLPGLIGMR